MDQSAPRRKSSSKTLDQITELSRDLGKPLDLVKMDGKIKSIHIDYVEEGGLVMESLKLDSLPEFMEKQIMEDISEKDEQTLMDEIQSLLSDEKSQKDLDESEEEEEEDENRTRTRLTADSMPFDKFLDFMEIF